MIKNVSSLVFALLLLVPASLLSQVILPSGGADIGTQINGAEATLPTSGGKIVIQTQPNGQCYSFTTPIVANKAVIIEGQGPSTCLNFVGTGTAISFRDNVPPFTPPGSYVDSFGLRDLTLKGSGPGNSQIGLQLGGSTDSVGFYGSGLTISNFGLGLQFGRGVWNFKMEHSIFGLNGQNVHWASSLHFGGENVEFDGVTFIGSTFENSVQFDDNTDSDFSNLNNLTFVSCNFDSAQLVINNGAGGIRLYAPHFENPAARSDSEPFVRITAHTAATDVVMDGPDFYNDQSNPYPPSFIEIDGGPSVLISQMRSVNLDGSDNVPTNLLIAGDAYVTLVGDAPLRAAKTQYIVASGNPHMWVMGGQDATNNVVSQSPLLYTQSYGPDSQSPVVQMGGSGYNPTIGLNLWSGSGSTYYGVELTESAPGELDFCSSAAAPIGSGNYICNAGVVNGVFKSKVPEGTAPMTVTSHTPPDNLNAWPATFSPSGAQIQNPHLTAAKVLLPSSGQITIPFQFNSKFTAAPFCTVTYQTTSAYLNLRNLTFNPTPSTLTIFGQPYIGVYFICVGN